MTVIAWDGETLAADKMVVDGGGISRTTTKIFSHRGHSSLLAVTGNWDVGLELKEWWESGEKAGDFPQAARSDRACLIVINEFGIRSYNSGPYPLRHEVKKCAFGSGRDFAEAAMFCGKSAEEAVLVACAFQSDCGNGVDSFRLARFKPTNP